MAERVLVLVDLQKDYFPGGRWELEGIEAAAANAARLLAGFRAAGEPVVHVRHETLRELAPFFAKGSEGAEIAPVVAPRGGEAVIVKNHPNSFRSTSLDEVLRALLAREIVIAGAMSHMCIDATVRAAADLGWPVTVAHDACATRALIFEGREVPAAEVHAAFMAALAFGYAKVVPTEVALAALPVD